MAIIRRRRLPWPELLFVFVGVWLCLPLDPNAAARVPSDRFVFPSESQPKLESRLKEIDREMAEMSRLTNVTLLMMSLEAKKAASTGSEKPPITATGNVNGEIRNITNPIDNPAEIDMTRNQTYPASESKKITFGSDPESNGQRPWELTEVPLTVKPNVVVGPRITLESTRICPEGFTLSTTHCRKNA